MNTVTGKQFAILVFIMTLTFKIGRLPSLMADKCGNSALAAVIIYLAVELVIFAVVYRCVKNRAFETIDKHLPVFASKALYFAAAAYFIMKLTLMLLGTTLFVNVNLSDSMPEWEAAVLLLVPVTYMAVKGIKAIGRTSEILFWPIAAFVLFSLVFMKTDIDINRNLPILNTDLKTFLGQINNFYFWFGDYIPLMLLSVSDAGKKYVTASLAAGVAVALTVYVLLNAVYGELMSYISEPLVKFAAFNQFGKMLGRLDWTGIIAWLAMAVIYSSLFMWAAVECLGRIIGKRWPAVAFTAGTVLVLSLVIPNLERLSEYAMSGIKYFAAFYNYVLPFAILAAAAAASKARAKKESANESV